MKIKQTNKKDSANKNTRKSFFIDKKYVMLNQ